MDAPTQTLGVLQLHTCYGRYLTDFYARTPHLEHASFKEQSRALVRDAYSAVHMLAPYLPGCRSELLFGNCVPMQRAWCRENGVPFSEDKAGLDAVVREQIARFAPDVLYITATGAYSTPFIRSLEPRPPVVMGWRGSDVPAATDWSGYDVMLSGLPRLLALAESLGARRGRMFHPGMPAWIAREVENIPQTIDVAFVGSIWPVQHVYRKALLETLSEAAARHGFSLALHLMCEPWCVSPAMQPYVRPPVFGMDMHRALRQARIVIDDRAYHGVIMPDGSKKMDLGGDDTINMRMFEATGGGSLLLTPALPGVARYFEPGSEAAVYTDNTDAVEKILYYLAHEEERNAMATAGRARCLEQWNMNVCARRFLDMAREILTEKNA